MGRMDGRRKPGPPHKGDRSAFTVRVPADHRPALDEAAKAAGMKLGDFVACVLAERLDLPTPSYINRDRGHPTLPISA